ncbi:MAG TPA: flavin reductase family protein [Alphaproteobacteria bacterium]|nr:flavin reductase family protein [Alphaproteobacteria bacterium]
MEFDIATLPNHDAYMLLIGVIVPRPIAFVTTLDGEGRLNAAPFSFFNMLGHDPPVVALGIETYPDGRAKDTARNIAETREFVVNMVDEAIAERMVQCATDFPHGLDELEVTGLTPQPSTKVKPPRIAESPISLECIRLVTLELGKRENIVLGEVKHLRIRDDLVDAERRRVHLDRLRLVGRLAGHRYCRIRDQFDLRRESYASWLERQPAPAE